MKWGEWNIGSRNIDVDELFHRIEKEAYACKPKVLSLLFMTQSVRTRTGFERAAYNLGCDVINVYERRDGESMQDFGFTLHTVSDACIARVPTQSDFDEFCTGFGIQGPVINAGTDSRHPTQALTDVYTLLEAGVPLGSKIGLFGSIDNRAMRSFHDLALRQYQVERYRTGGKYQAIYCVTYGTHGTLPDSLRGCYVMHPFPRGGVVPTNYDFTPQDLYHRQMENAVRVREAILCAVL